MPMVHTSTVAHTATMTGTLSRLVTRTLTGMTSLAGSCHTYRTAWMSLIQGPSKFKTLWKITPCGSVKPTLPCPPYQ